MAGKRRTPPPPRRVQAPQQRRDPRSGPNRRTLLLLLGALALAAIGIGAFLLLRGGDEETGASARTALEAAGCRWEERPALEAAVHIDDPDATPEQWNTDPPTSGPHFGTPAIWGEYDEPIQLARAVHNLEHGGVAMYYGDDVPDDEVAALRRFYRDDPAAMLLAPLPTLGDEIALTAWHSPLEEEGEEGEPLGIVVRCSRVDESAFEDFRDTYRFKGPERFPPEALQPGM